MKLPHLLISADILRTEHVEMLASAVAGWATWEHVAESLEEAEFARKLARTEMVAGWAPAPLLLPSAVQLYLCGSAGFDAYLNRGLENKPGYVHCNASGIMSVPIAEHALAMMFALLRRMPEHADNQRNNRFVRISHATEAQGSTACIAGIGGAGTELARRCLALGMKVIGVCRDAGRLHSLISSVYALEDLKEAVVGADHVFCTLPGSPATAHVFNERVFAAMKPGAKFYNIGRGMTVDEIALMQALHRGHLHGAGLDVLENEPPPPGSPLWDCPNLILTGHSAGVTVHLADRLCELFRLNLVNRREGRPLHNVIDLGAAA